MKERHVQEVTGTTQDAISAGQTEHLPLQKVGIAVRDLSNRRLLETIAASLELEPMVVEVEDLKVGRFAEFELVIARP